MPQMLRDSRACSIRHFEPQWRSSFGIASVIGFSLVPFPAAGIIPIILSLNLYEVFVYISYLCRIK